MGCARCGEEGRNALGSTPTSSTPSCRPPSAQADRRFWEEDDAIYGGISWIDDVITQMWYPSSGYFGTRGVLTGAYNFTSRARRFGNLDLRVSATLSTALERLETAPETRRLVDGFRLPE